MMWKKVLLIGGVVCGFAAVGLLAYDNIQLRNELQSEARTINGRLAEIESEVYCNAKWIKGLQEDTTDADAIKVLEERLTSDEYRNAEDVEELSVLLEAPHRRTQTPKRVQIYPLRQKSPLWANMKRLRVGLRLQAVCIGTAIRKKHGTIYRWKEL